VLLGFYAVASLDGLTQSRVALEQFRSRASEPQSTTAGDMGEGLAKASGSRPDELSFWAAGRLAAFERTLGATSSFPIAVLRCPRIHLEVPVFRGTGKLDLNRGVGWISGTAAPGEEGRTGIAGHRDGFFRKLGDVVRGDEIVLQTPRETETFRVTRIVIVKPENTSILKNQAGRSLALVTCYPFYYVGKAPLRFVVEGALESTTNRPTIQRE